jgi:protein O-mannosyl-transferase
MKQLKLAPLLQNKLAPSVLLAGILVVVFLLYYPGLFGDFIFDDYINIINNTNAHLNQVTLAEIQKVLGSGVASTLSRPLSMLTFGINYYLTGFDPFYFKLTNILIHLLTSIGVYLLALELFRIGPGSEIGGTPRRELLALVVAACWALHPLNVSTVLYVVQRMTLLSALATIYTLLYYCKFRQRETCSRSQAIIAFGIICVATVTGVLFKESAALIVLFILCIEIFLLHFRAPTIGHRWFLNLFVWLMVIIPAVGALVVLATSPESLIGSYEVRTFTLGERLLTEARVLWRYIGWLLMPDTRELVFYYDDFRASRSLLDPPATLLAIAGLLGVGAFVVLARKRMPFLCFGLAFFFAGHAMESTVVSLELVFEHRNYVPGVGLILGVIHAFRQLPEVVLRGQVTTAFLCLYIAFLAHGTYTETRKWSDSYNQLAVMTAQNPESHRANYGMGYFLLQLASAAPDRRPILDLSAEYFERASKLDPTAIRGHVGVIQANGQNARPIDQDLLDDLYHRVTINPRLRDYIGDISNLTNCWYAGFCKFDGAILTNLYNAMAANTASSPVVVQGLLDQIGSAIAYAFNRKEDGKAILYLAQGVRADLTIIDLKLIQLEIESGNYAQARQLLEQAKERSTSNFADDLQRLEVVLDEATNQ